MEQALMSEIIYYDLDEVKYYINWLYFFHSWRFPAAYSVIAHMSDEERCAWIGSLEASEKPKAEAAVRLYEDAQAFIRDNNGHGVIKFKYALFKAYSDCDDIIVNGTRRIPFLRQQLPDNDNICLCLSDYIAPAGDTDMNVIGVFAATTDLGQDIGHESGNDYLKFLSQTLAERLVEAAVEKSHECIRREKWGYAKDERMSIDDLHKEKFCGIRPAVGYPSIPDQSINFLIDELIDLASIGIELTENGAMSPAASVDGFMFSNPHSRYFSVGKISQEQMNDYSSRRGISMDKLSRFLIRNTL